MRSVLPGQRSPAGRAAQVGTWVGVALVIGALGWMAGDGLAIEGRARLVRYVGILIAAGLAIGAPHVLYPDPHAAMLQLSNPSPRRLLQRQLARWAPIPAALAVPGIVVALSAPTPSWALAAEGVLAVLALGLYVLVRTAALGVRSQAWERTEAGGWYRALNAWAPPVRFLVPDPLVPGLLLTGEVFLVGAAVAVVGQGGGMGAGLAASGLVLALAVALAVRQARTFDRAFWTTHGVWADAFRQAAGPASGREPLRYGAVYWAPPAVRPSVWAGLLSLDRRFPLGRVAAALLALIVIVHASGATAGVRLAALALYVVGMNGAIALTTSADLMPEPLAHRLGGKVRWALVRFLMNVRWLPPLGFTVAGLAWLTEDIGARSVAVWTIVDLAGAALSATLATLFARARLRRAVA